VAAARWVWKGRYADRGRNNTNREGSGMSSGSKLLNAIEKGMVILVYVLVALMVINTTVGVFARYVLNRGIPWTEELGRYMMIWMGFFGCALAAKDNSHVGVEMFVEIFKPGVKRIFSVAARLVVVAFLVVVLLKSGDQLSLLKIQKSSAMEIPMVIPYSAVTVGVFMMLVENIVHVFKIIKAPLAGKTLE
jgi:TRAP-type C4-dicarboxylate transport system permease small subunit